MKITIPPAAIEAGARALAKLYFTNDIDRHWPEFVEDARAAFEAMVGAWPEARIGYVGMRMDKSEMGLKLPFTENPDAE